MTSSNDPRPEQHPEAPLQERSLPHLLGHLAQQATDGTVKMAAGYATGKVMEKVFGGKDKDGEKPEPPADPPPAQAE
jgi:hypothetical protein